MARDIRNGEEEIAELLACALRHARIRGFVRRLYGRLELVELFFRLVENGRHASPIEPNLGRTLLKLHRARQRGERKRYVAEAGAGVNAAPFGLLRILDPSPHVGGEELLALRVAEDVRMPPQHLPRDAVYDVGEVEPAFFRGHLRVIHDLEQEVSELFLQRLAIVARDRVGDLVSLFDRVRSDRGVALRDVPRAARILVAQPRHHREQVIERVASCGSLSHGVRPADGEIPFFPQLDSGMPCGCPNSGIRIRYIMENYLMTRSRWVANASPSSVPLVAIGNQPVEQPHAKSRSPASIDLAVDRRHRRAGDVEMRPRRSVLDEALKELRG